MTAESTSTNASTAAVPTATADASITAMVPKDIAARGFITVAVNPSSPPIKYLDPNGKITGFAPDLITAAAATMGLTVQFEQTSFDALIPGLDSHRFDMILSINDFKDRQKTIDFIDYLETGTAIMGREDLEQDTLTPAELCGLSVGFVRGNVQQGLLQAASDGCVEESKPAVTATGFQDINAAILAVQSGRLDSAWGDSPSMVYNAAIHPEHFKILYEEAIGPYGMGVAKDNPELRDALRAGLLQTVETGIYDALLQNYSLTEFARPGMELNQGPAQ